MIGVAIGRYVIRSRLAQGGMGAVYLAAHESLNVKKVVKVLLPEYSRNDVIRQRFEREAKAAASFGNSHIVAIDDFGSLPDGQLFLMMPFLQGKPLDAHIAQNGKLSLHHTLQIIVQVCDALTTLHEAGVVHRDLKPGNIFISETPDNAYHVTIIDLGIARDAKSEDLTFKTHTGMAMGTPGYMAVEQFSNAANAGPTADVYALAIITWEMLTGQMPWGIHDPRVMYHLQMTAIPEPPAGHDLPPDVLGLLTQTLSPTPEHRPQSAQVFAMAFASMTPAIPPHVPSGAEILARYAKRLVQNVSPDLATVRNSSNADRSAPVLWPHRGTAVPPVANNTPASASGAAIPVATPFPAYVSAATVNERPVPLNATPPPTTLGAASGVTTPPTVSPSPKRSTLALLGLAGCVVAGLATFAIVQLRKPSSAAATSEPIEEQAQRGSAPATPALPDAGVESEVVAADASVAVTPPDGAVDQVKVATTPDAGVSTPAKTTKRARPDSRKQPTVESPKTTKKPGTDPFDPNAVEE